LTRIDNDNIMNDDDGRKSLGECLVILQVDLKKLEHDCMNIEEVGQHPTPTPPLTLTNHP
jgi:hypothetical protein